MKKITCFEKEFKEDQINEFLIILVIITALVVFLDIKIKIILAIASIILIMIWKALKYLTYTA